MNLLENRYCDILRQLNKEKLPADISCADYAYTMTAICRSDGTVAVFGRNADKIDCGSWTGISQVACGRNHVVALRSNGTVVASGDNSSGQCNVETWTDICQVACTNWLTVGLKKDGTVLQTGLSLVDDRWGTGDWTDVKKIVCGEDYVLGLKTDGTVLASEESMNMLTMRGFRPYGQGEVLQWKNIIDISAGFQHSAGLSQDGTVRLASATVPYGRDELAEIKDAVGIKCVGNQTIIQHTDNSISVCGFAQKKRTGLTVAEIADKVLEGFPGASWSACPLNFSLLQDKYRSAVVLVTPSKQRMTLDEYTEPALRQDRGETNATMSAVMSALTQAFRENGIDYYQPMGGMREDSWSSFSCKEAAVRAGMGWIGKNALFITKEYGPRVSMNAVLIDDDVTYGKPTAESLCGDCEECVKACMLQVLYGTTWEAGMKPSEIGNFTLCAQGRDKIGIKMGRRFGCGKCIVSCPYGADPGFSK